MLTLDAAPPAINANAYDLMADAAARAAELKWGNLSFPSAEGYSAVCDKLMEEAYSSALGGCDARNYRTDPGEEVKVGRDDIIFGAANLAYDYPLETLFMAIRQALDFIGYEGHDEPEGDWTLIEVRKGKHATRPYTALIRNKPLADTAGRTRTFATRAAAEKAAGLALAWSHGTKS